MTNNADFYRQMAARLFQSQHPAATPGSQPGPYSAALPGQVGGFANVPGDWKYWRNRLAGTPIEAKQSSGDRYANLTSDPFAMGGPVPGAGMFGG